MIFTLVLFISLATSEATYCAGLDEDTVNIYTSPSNCSHFIACIDNEEYEYECLSAEVFYPGAESLCVGACASKATTKKASSKPESDLPPDSLLYPDSPAKTIICPPSGETKAVIAQSCTEYISCKKGIGKKEACKDGEEFSPTQFHCVPSKLSDCPRKKLKGSHHIKCRYDKGGEPVYFSSEKCPEFKKCANQLSWNVKCAQYTHWNDELKNCDWADSFDCHLTNFKK